MKFIILPEGSTINMLSWLRNILIQRTISKLMKEKGIFTTYRERNLYNLSPSFVSQK